MSAAELGLSPINSMPDAESRRQTFVRPTGDGDILSHFIGQHAAAASHSSPAAADSDEEQQQQQQPAAVVTPPSLTLKKAAAAISGSESARRANTRRSVATVLSTPASAGSSTPRGGVSTRGVGVHSGGATARTTRNGLAASSSKENATRASAGSASPMGVKRKSTAVLPPSGLSNSSSATNRLASTTVVGALSKKPRVSVAPTHSRSGSATALSSTSVAAPSPRRQLAATSASSRRTLAPTIARALSSEDMQMTDVAPTAAQAHTLSAWKGAAQWRLVLLRSSQQRLRASESSLADAEALHHSLESQLASAQVEMQLGEQKLAVATSSAQMLKLASEELSSTVERLREQASKDRASFEEQLAALRQELAASNASCASTEEALRDMTQSEHALRRELAHTEAELQRVNSLRHVDEQRRKALHRQVQDLKGSIRVFCRIRPSFGSDEAEAEQATQMAPQYSKGTASGSGGEFSETLSVVAPALTPRFDGTVGAPSKTSFVFDKVFSPLSDQVSVFGELDDIVVSALDSSTNVSVFAYGATGSGKTHTMIGGGSADMMTAAEDGHVQLDAQAGMIPRAIQRLFAYAAAAKERVGSGWTYSFKASLLEIYNDEIRDLCPSAAKKVTGESSPPLKVVHDRSTGRVCVAGLEVVPVSCARDATALLSEGSKSRSVASTACNSRSSRSHTVFTLVIEGVHASSSDRVHSTLNLVDLAGSERLDTSRVASNPTLLKETQHINSSLSTLIKCMHSIASKQSHVAFRDSTLTHLLQDSLQGSRGVSGASGAGGKSSVACPPSRTLFFINISPEAQHHAETMCTLKFAEKLKQVEMNAATHIAAAAAASSSSSAAAATSDASSDGALTARRTRRKQ